MPVATITRIATIQHSLRELGRIRLGEKGAKGEPRKLKTFRLTSASRTYIEAAAAAYGGTVRAWESPRGQEFEVTIESMTLDVLVPPGQMVMQAFEMWTAGGCARRCDGLQQETGETCACPADTEERTALAAKGQACKPTTRLWVILPKLPDLGRWRLESHGFYAAVELPGMAEIAAMATARGVMLPARLRIDQRRRKIPGQPTREYIVPVLELPETNFGQLVASGHIATTDAQLPAGPTVAGVPQLDAIGPDSIVANEQGEYIPTQRQIAAPRAPRVPRPAMGPAPSLPAEARFERPAAPGFGAAPATRGGWRVDDTQQATGGSGDSPVVPAPSAAAVVSPSAAAEPSPAVCGDEDASPMALGLCTKPKGHSGTHGSEAGTWPR